jgi:arsenate reductase
MNEKKAKQIALENPSIIKRPLLVKNSKSYLGFSPENYSKILA